MRGRDRLLWIPVRRQAQLNRLIQCETGRVDIVCMKAGGGVRRVGAVVLFRIGVVIGGMTGCVMTVSEMCILVGVHLDQRDA